MREMPDPTSLEEVIRRSGRPLPLGFSGAVLCLVVASALLAGCGRGNSTNGEATSASRTGKDGGSEKQPVTDTESEHTPAEQTPVQTPSDEAVASQPKRSAEAQRLARVLKDGKVARHWFYDDIGGAMAEAMATGKPLFVAFR